MGLDYTKPEIETREEFDQMLILAGWVIQDKKRLNLFESLGVAVREMDADTGPTDYMLFVAGKACGIIEAKREGTNLGQTVFGEPAYPSIESKAAHFLYFMVKKPPLYRWQQTQRCIPICRLPTS